MRFCAKEAWLLTLGITADQITKLWALTRLKGGEISLLPFIRFRLSFNIGSAFGLRIIESRYIWIVLTLSFVFMLYLLTSKSRGLKFARVLMVSGAVGNLIDRILYGKVIDFIEISSWPSFNLADGMITTGLMLALFYLYKGEKDLDI